jgi:hypothetical protein
LERNLEFPSEPGESLPVSRHCCSVEKGPVTAPFSSVEVTLFCIRIVCMSHETDRHTDAMNGCPFLIHSVHEAPTIPSIFATSQLLNIETVPDGMAMERNAISEAQVLESSGMHLQCVASSITDRLSLKRWNYSSLSLSTCEHSRPKHHMFVSRIRGQRRNAVSCGTLRQNLSLCSRTCTWGYGILEDLVHNDACI